MIFLFRPLIITVIKIFFSKFFIFCARFDTSSRSVGTPAWPQKPWQRRLAAFLGALECSSSVGSGRVQRRSGKDQTKMWLSSYNRFSFIFGFFIFIQFLPCSAQYKNSQHTKKNQSVRVLLDSCNVSSDKVWQFFSQEGFFVQFVGLKKEKNIFRKNQIIIRIKNGHLFCNGKKVDHTIRLISRSGHGQLDGVAYDGDFFIIPHKNDFLCVNQVNLEDYIVAVLRTESWPGWPLEVNKVFAIACRSYVAFKIQEAQKNKQPFHVKNTNVHQTYKGRHNVKELQRAVEQTRGVVLGFDKKPILAMFDCCCGGIIPAHIADFDFNKAPYLARDYACSHCKQCSLYSWNIAYDHKAFEQVVKQHKKELHRLHGISITKKDKAGLVTEVKLKGARSHHTISGKQLYSLLKEVKSFHFDVQVKLGKIIFSGRGFGHHIGLCQWGARQMVRDGWGHKSILQFYYPQTQFMKLL